MKTIIAGSRTITDYSLVVRACKAAPWGITAVISGGAQGVDSLGERWGRVYDIPVTRYPAEWGIHGRRAGYLRNALMADNADALIAIWDGASRGTKHMIDIATSKGLKVFVFRTDRREEVPE